MRGKRAITPVIAVILLIVMTVGIAAFTFVWMQNFIQSLQTQTMQQAQQLQQRLQLAIGYATYSSQNISLVISNSGSVPIDISKLKITIEKYYKLNGSFDGAVIVNENLTCAKTGTLYPGDDVVCWKKLDEDLNFNEYNYIIYVIYKGIREPYHLTTWR